MPLLFPCYFLFAATIHNCSYKGFFLSGKCFIVANPMIVNNSHKNQTVNDNNGNQLTTQNIWHS